jgi:hypothetical protein
LRIVGGVGSRIWPPAEGKVGVLEIGEELAKRGGIDDGARQVVLPQRFGLFEHADVELGARRLRELGEFDGAGEAGGSRTDDHHVQLHPVPGARRSVLDQQLVQRQRRLMPGGNHPSFLTASVSCGRISNKSPTMP